MVREILKLKTDNGLGANNPPFKNIKITEYSFKSPLMGIPTLTAELLWPTCLDNEWTHKEYVELRGERYYIRQVQSSEISNNNVIKYKHSLDFKSEREQLLHVYFYDVVPSDISQSNSAGHDKPNTNSTKFKIYATPREFCDRLNCAFRYAGIGDSILETKTSLTDTDTPVGDGYCVVLSGYGEGDLNQSQEFEWEDKYLFDALSEGFDKFKIPFCFHGKKIVFNEYVEPIEHVFKYGFDDALLSIKKNNANARIINRITFKGSSENIEYYYPNETEYGHILLEALPGNSVLQQQDFEIISPNKLVGVVTSEQNVALCKKQDVEALANKLEYLDNKIWRQVPLAQWNKVTMSKLSPLYSVYYRITFTVSERGNVEITSIPGRLWTKDQSAPTDSRTIDNIIATNDFTFVKLMKGESEQYIGHTRRSDGHIYITDIDAGEYSIEFWMTWHIPASISETGADAPTYWQIDGIVAEKSTIAEYYWKAGEREFKNLETIGIKLGTGITDGMVGDGFRWDSVEQMPFQENLMPPKYRDTLGTERFYNALNNTYLKPDGKTYYTFKNPYVDGNPNEYIHTDETIKPTIEGVKNSQEELFGVISGIAFDADDNDSLKGDAGSEDKDKNDSANYAHSFFYIRLNKFDGEYGFNLFNSASQTDAMTIQMTSGKCNGCKFKIQVIEDENLNDKQWRNPVQTGGPDKDIIHGTQSQIIDKNNPQEWQQDTTKNYIWIAVQKDAETFGVIMPNRTHEYLPEVGDTFNIINIDLPQGYITAAEERGMYAMLDFMEENNEEKFNFDITASRIFFAEHPEILATLNENSRIKIEYNGEQYVQYVSEFAIDCKNNEVLPDVKLTLANTLEPSGSFVDEVVAQAVDATNIGKGRRDGAVGGLSTELADRRYVRKDKDDRTEHRISSDTAFEVGNFVSGSSGGILFVDPETGQSTLEVDYFKARIKAIFETLEIAHVRSIGGKLIITPGGSIDISFVEELDDVYRCYFKQQEEAEGADCRFIVGDDVVCQSFNISNGTHQNASNKYYWRKITAVSNEGSYVELSKTDCATGSDVPEIGDTICQLGSDDVSRQSAIILSTVDTFSPNITLYDGVTNFTLVGKEMVDMGVDQTTNKAYFHVYGNAYIGDKEGNSFLKYDNLLKLLEIKAKLQIGTTVGNQTLEEYIQQVSPPVEQEDIEQFVNNIVDPKIEGIQNQIDGVIETWFYNGVPTPSNYPASEWGTAALKIQHLGDLYYDNNTGTAYRFSQNTDGSFYWNKITDEAITKALAAAQKAQDTADSKRRVFTSQPQAKDIYDPGDLWVNATYGTQYSNDILRCVTHKDSGAAFNISHWTLASKYTDDSALNTFIAGYQTTINGLKEQIDGKVETWYFGYDPKLTNKPASEWTTSEDKAAHSGDLFYNTATKKVFRWTGSAWESMTDPDIQAALDAASDAQDTADNKRRVFMTTPTTPYDKGDLWIDNGADGKTLKVCIAARASGSYTASDWAVADDASLNAFSTAITNTLNGIKDQIDQKAETWYQDTDPSTAWTTAALKAEHKGDLWYNTTDGTTWYWDGTAWQQQDVPNSVFDAIDGKSAIFVSKPTSGYLKNDLWFLETDYTLSGVAYKSGTLVVAKNDMGAAWSASDWIKKDRYTDDTAAQAAAAAAAQAQSSADNAQSAAQAAQTSVTNLSNYIDGAFKDGVISESEASAIATYINTINANKQAIDGTYAKLYANTYLAASGKTALKTAYDNVSAKIKTLLYAINTAIADGAVTDTEKTSVDSDFAAFNTAYNSFSTAVEAANKSIQDVLKSYADAAKVAADNAQSAADAAQADADTANNRLTQWAADGVISPTEKQSIKDEIARIDADKAHIAAEYTRYGLGTATTYNNAQDAYRAQLVTLSAATPENITIPSNFASNQIEYYKERTTALSAIAAAAKKYAADIAKQEAEKAVAGYEYLKKALKDVTTISGGLMLSGLIRLGENNADPNAQTVWAGHNGIYSTTALGRTIGSWWGGDMLDRFDANDNRLNVAGKRYATSLIRMDGSAYFADGLVGFRKNGSGWLAGNNIKWDATGAITFGNGIKIDLGGGNNATLGGIQSSLASVVDIVNALGNVLIPVDSAGNKVAWDSADLFAVKSIKGFYSEEFVSAKGVNPNGGSSGGASYDRLDAWTDYTSDKAGYVLSAALGYDLHTRVTSLEGKNYLDALTLVHSGSGNAVTAVVLSADKKTITVTKGASFLTTHQAIYDLTIQKNGTTIGTFDPNGAAKTINISDVASASTLSSHTSNTTVHITSAERTKWNKVVTDFAAITGTDSDSIINKWEEVVAFLDTYTEADTLANLLSNKVDKVSGMGLSHNDFTDTLLKKLNGIEAGANNYVLPTASASVKGGVKVGSGLAIASGVLAVSLSASHIPNLSWNKITSDKPTTLSGYGITDGVNSVTVTGSGNAVTSASVSGHKLTLTKGTTFLPKATFDELFEKVNIGTATAPVYAIKAKFGLYTEQFLSARGVNPNGGSGGGSGLIQAVYGSASLGGTFSDSSLDDTFNAYTINKINSDLSSRISSLEGGSALSVNTTGSGNAITAISKSGTTITATKGATFLTQHQSLANYVTLNTNQTISGQKTFSQKVRTTNVFSAGELMDDAYGFVNVCRTKGLANAACFSMVERSTFAYAIGMDSSTISIVMGKSSMERTITPWIHIAQGGVTAPKFIKSGGTSSQFLMADGSVKALTDITNTYVTALGTSGNYLTWTKNGAVNNITVPFATAALSLNFSGYTSDLNEGLNHNGTYSWNPDSSNKPGASYGVLLQWSNQNTPVAGTASHWITQLASATAGQGLWVRTRDNRGSWRAWERILTSANFNSTLDSRYVKKSGDTMTGALSLPRVNINAAGSTAYFTSDANYNAFIKIGERALMVWNNNEASVRPGISYNNIFSLGTSVARWSNVYATTINVTSTALVSNLNADLWDGQQFAEFRMRKIYTLDLSALSTSNFYPITFPVSDYELDCEIHSPGLGASAAYNQNHIHFLFTARGWNDVVPKFRILSQGYFDYNEQTIGAIGAGDQGGMKCVWLRGGMEYRIVANHKPTLRTSDFSHGNEIFTVGTNLYGGTNANVTIRWQNNADRSNSQFAICTDNVASATKLQTARTLWGQSFNGTANVSGNMTGVGTIYNSSTSAPYLQVASTPTNAGNLGTAIGFGPSPASYGLFIWGEGTGKGHIQVGRKDGITTAYNLILQEFGGNVGIGTNSPTYKLHVSGSAFASTLMANNLETKQLDLTYIQQPSIYFHYNGTSAATQFIRAVNATHLRISHNLDVDGNLSAPVVCVGPEAFFLWDDDAGRLVLDNAGQMSVLGVIHSTSGIYSDGYVSARGQNTSSDIRLKNLYGDFRMNIHDIAAAPSKKFLWKNDNQNDVGSIAQYWERINPCLTPKNADGTLTLQYGKTALLSVIAVAKKTVDLEKRVKVLEKENSKLREQIKKLS